MFLFRCCWIFAFPRSFRAAGEGASEKSGSLSVAKLLITEDGEGLVNDCVGVKVDVSVDNDVSVEFDAGADMTLSVGDDTFIVRTTGLVDVFVVAIVVTIETTPSTAGRIENVGIEVGAATAVGVTVC